MFNNPFTSFHNTVAEAKEEREQLDRLLTISTPNERILVVVVFLLVGALALWLFFGSLSQSVSKTGILVSSGDELDSNERTVHVQLPLEEKVALLVSTGMPMTIAQTGLEETSTIIHGTITAISKVGIKTNHPRPPLVTDLYRIAIEPAASEDLSSLTNEECHVVFDLGTQSPLEVFGFMPY